MSASAAVSYTNVLLESGSFIYRVQQLNTSKMNIFILPFFVALKSLTFRNGQFGFHSFFFSKYTHCLLPSNQKRSQNIYLQFTHPVN